MMDHSSSERKNEQEFLHAYDSYSNAIFRHLYFRIGDREKAKDLMQETFMRTWEYMTHEKPIENIRAFLYRTAHHLMVDEFRKKKTVSLDQLMEDENFQPAAEQEDLGHKIDAHRMLHLLEKLEDGERNILLMRYIDDFSPQEIAESLGATANIISVRLNRALHKLRTLYLRGL